MNEHRRITDAGVAGLPIHEGRAELLEEIMATTPLETAPTSYGDPTPPRRGRWLTVGAAAAAVAAVAAGAVWVGTLGTEPSQEREDLPVASAPGSGELAVLPVDGWELAYASVDPEHGGEISYVPTGRADDPPAKTVCMVGGECTDEGEFPPTFDIHWRPADQYQSYYDDRADIGRGEQIEVLGRSATLWAYSPDDHTAIREVVGDFTLEFRGSGMDEAAYRALLDQLLAIEPSELDAHLPESFVTEAERPAVIEEMLASLPQPDGAIIAIRSEEVHRYQLGVEVVAAVTCVWIERFATAKEAGDDAVMQEAADALASSRDWALLKEMDAAGDYPEVIWEMADAVQRGEVPVQYRQGLGCD